MTRIFNRLVFSGHGGKLHGTAVNITVDSDETDIVFDCFYGDNVEYIFVTGDVVTGSFTEVGTELSWDITGAITPTTGENVLTWTRSVADVARVGIYTLSFKVVATTPIRTDRSFAINYVIKDVPGGGAGSPDSPTLVQLLAAWGVFPTDYGTSFVYDTTHTWSVDTAVIEWPDGSAGVYTVTSRSANAFALGLPDAYTATHTDSGLTVTQAAVTRNTAGNVTVKPTLVIA